MDLTPLPARLRTRTNQDVPNAIADRLNYLWTAACALAPTAVPPVDGDLLKVSAMSHRLSKSFVEFANSNNIDIPECAAEKLCSNCSILFIPTVTFRTRLRSRSKNSKVNRFSKSKSDRLRNELTMQCCICGSTRKSKGYLQRKNKLRDRLSLQSMNPVLANSVSESDIKGQLNYSPASASPFSVGTAATNRSNRSTPIAMPISGGSIASTNGDKRKFSFLGKSLLPQSHSSNTQSQQQLKRRDSAPARLDTQADFVSFTKPCSNGNNAGGTRGGNSSSSSSMTPSGKSYTGNGAAAAGSATVNLLELERLQKKAKKKKRMS
mmetsp:Transcript_33325/g.55958  ORF Transcript_33325/g.55958 Transcript_33325/m.55958 type:complete len:322 (-) Transcript_33325:35-1000(-)